MSQVLSRKKLVELLDSSALSRLSLCVFTALFYQTDIEILKARKLGMRLKIFLFPKMVQDYANRLPNI